MKSRLTCLFSLILVACATTYTPRTNSRADVVAYVESAAALVAREGPDAACEKFAQPAWMSGDWYIFVNSLSTGEVLCHPARPDMVGQNQQDLRDVNGVYVTREMDARVNSAEGRGWVEYMWPRPGQTTPVRKSAYVIGVTGPDGKRYFVGSGGYDMR